MRPILKLLALFTFGFLAMASPVFALTVLKQDEAKSHLGDIKAHIMSGQYTYDILLRNHRDAMHGRFSDGVIFNTGGGRFLSLRRRDGEHKVVIDSPEGKEKDPVSEDDWRRKIGNALSDDNTFAAVFLDDAKKELAIVFVGRGTQVIGQMNDKGLLEIAISVEGARDRDTSFRRRR